NDPGSVENKKRAGRSRLLGLTVWEGAHDTRAPADLAQDALERIVGADATPVLLRRGIVGERLEGGKDSEFSGHSMAVRAFRRAMISSRSWNERPPVLFTNPQHRSEESAGRFRSIRAGRRPHGAVTQDLSLLRPEDIS